MKKVIKVLAIILIFININTVIAGAGSYLKTYKDLKYYTTSLESNSDLQEYSKQYLKENFNLKLNIDILFNGKCKELNGAFFYNIKEVKPNKIELYNKEKYACEHEIERVLIHELNHYALFVLGKDFKDGQKDFEILNWNSSGISNFTNKRNPYTSKLLNYCCD